MTAGLVASGVLTGSGVFVQAAPVGAGFTLDAGDLRFILKQIDIAEAHSAGGDLFGPGPQQVNERRLPFGLRTVDGSYNHLTPGETNFGAADQIFPRLGNSVYLDGEPMDPPGPAPLAPTSYNQTKGFVQDSAPRVISNIIVDQTQDNPAAVAVSDNCAELDGPTCFIGNEAPDVGLSAPFNSMFTFFGQFFDHGLDLVTKGGGTVFIPLQTDDPLYNPAPGSPNFLLLTRATNQPGPDGITGDDPATVGTDESIDDVKEATNTTTPFVDQNQTYTSHPSHQVFLREYVLEAGRPVSTGKLIDGAGGNIGNWEEVKAQAATMLGIGLVDADIFNVPLLATDAYGYFIRGANGFPMVMFNNGATAVEGNPAAPISVAGSDKTGHAFLDDIGHNASPKNSQTGAMMPADGDSVINDLNTPLVGVYDDELLAEHFITGDGRGNENIALTAVHSVFHSEHNRLQTDINSLINQPGFLTPAEVAAWEAVGPSGWDYGERLFQAARFVTEMEYQHLVFEEFARKLVPTINPFIGDGINFQSDTNPAISAEFAHSVYRLGHSMLTENIPRTYEDGTTDDMSLLDGFLNPVEFTQGGTLTASEAAGAIFQGGTREQGNHIDEFVTDVLRNNLLGLPLDLAVFNIARGRSEGLPSLNSLRRQLLETTGETSLTPYESWGDFQFNMKYAESLINFIGAYGTHPLVTGLDTDGAGTADFAGSVLSRRTAADSIVNGSPLPAGSTVDGLPPVSLDAPADSYDFLWSQNDWANEADGTTITGVDDIDLWMGGLAERTAPFGGMLGSTFGYIFEIQLENLQNADRFYYLERLDGLNLLPQLEANSLAEIVMRNTTATGLAADIFSRPDFAIEVPNLGTSGAILDDPLTDYQENTFLTRLPNGTIRFNGGEHVNWNGSDTLADKIISSEGDDTMRGNGGNDVLEGGSGNDSPIGGMGDDIETDIFGDDVMKGGPGNDAIFGGPGFDLLQGNADDDYIIAGNDTSEVFGGSGDDVIYSGDGGLESFAGAGDDWMEAGPQLDLIVGDENNQFQDDPNGGHDVLIGGKGDDDYDAEGGDDIMVGDVLGTERFEGMLGFDMATYRGDALPVDVDMNINIVLAPNLDETRDRFDLTEGVSGWNFNDFLRGTDRVADELVGHELTAAGIARIAGIDAILAGATSFSSGDILLGGQGSDSIEGRIGDDILDGDRWLNAQLRAPIPASPGNFRLVDGLKQLQTDVRTGQVNPGSIDIVRSIVTPPAANVVGNIDTAVFTGPRADYTVAPSVGGSLLVTDNVGTDGVDRLWNIERLQFADQTVSVLPAVALTAPANLATVSGTAVVVSASVTPGLFGVAGVRFFDGLTQIGAEDTTSPYQVNWNTLPVANGSHTLTAVVRDATGATVTSAARTVTVNNVADVIAPTVTVTPLANAVNVAANTNVTATFSENVQGLPAIAVLTAGTNFRVVRTSNGAAVTALSIQYNSATRVATFDPLANLLPGVQYTATLLGGAGAIRDIANNPLVTTSWNFTIIDNVAPTVTARTPAANATGVTVPVSPTATFSEPLNASTVNATTMTVRVGTLATGTLVPSVVAYNAGTQVATINPNASLLNDTVYTVRLTNGIQDVAGNALVATQWTFTTGPAPTVIAQSPAPNATGFSRTGNPTATFSENMNAATVVAANVTLRLGTAANGTLIAGAVTYNAATRVVTINPTVAALGANTQYTVRLLAGLRDTAGNAITPVTWSFRTGA